MNKVTRMMVVWAVALWSLLYTHTFVAAGPPQQPGRGFSFADRLRVTGHEPSPFPSSPRFRRGKFLTGKFFPQGKPRVVVPFFTGFDHHHPVTVTSPRVVNIVVKVSAPPPSEPTKPAEPRLCPWIWTRETGKQCLDEAFPSQRKDVVLRAPDRGK